ncbi:XisI protein [Haliscomenobacter hydrossis DSM 1100]|uniref:XisI protein n=1 Tax=Haliscomenobacter hydrossis (strain ATCC 27775 / DSM 1100 / LMG 10767 / O) TaxID=760192 RepID=F4L5X8_HALH1|nr:XisI protein [Haliscomenobacter hydrossis DSM 1100]
MDKLTHYTDIIKQVITEYATDYNILGVLEEVQRVSLHNILHRRPRSQKLQNKFRADAGILDDGFATQNFRIGCDVFELQHFYHCF